MALLKVDNLATHFNTPQGVARAVDGVSFNLEPGQSLALVGESGCGKSVTALSLMGLVDKKKGFHPQGQVVFEGRNLLALPPEKLRQVRGNRLSMIFQEPMTSLNPVFTVGNQLAEPMRLHQGMAPAQARRAGGELLERLGFAEPGVVLDSYPHQLSGGMRQRAMIAMAIACRPRLMIADEPTTALDVTVQAQILYLLRELTQDTGMALILITHDLGIVNQMADKVVVMYAGQVAEEAPRQLLLADPRHPYTAKLMASIPHGVGRDTQLKVIEGQVAPATQRITGCRFAARCHHAQDRCRAEAPPLFPVPAAAVPQGQAPEERLAACFLFDPAQPLPPRQEQNNAQPHLAPAAANPQPLLAVEGLTTHFPIRRGFFQRVVGHVRAVDGVSLALAQGRTLALVGESGCGKSTLGYSLLRLEAQAKGRVVFQGKELLGMSEAALRPLRAKLQIIFQDPYASLNPRLTVGEVVGEGLRVHEPALSDAEVRGRIAGALEEVGLPPEAASRYPHAFSGGQRQRVALARALVLRPALLVLDEPTSALDVSVQAQILNLLKSLQARHQLGYLFISHDLRVVSYLADQVAVMYLGRLVEQGPVERLFANPGHPYTQGLLAAMPSLTERHAGPPPVLGDVPSPVAPPSGCHFHPRCPVAAADPALKSRCAAEYPPERPVSQQPVSQQPISAGHWAKCWALGK